MSSRTQTLRCAAAAALLTLAGTEARACVACFGQSDSAMAKGMNMGIFTLLLVILSVLASIAVFFVYLVHRGSQLARIGIVNGNQDANQGIAHGPRLPFQLVFLCASLIAMCRTRSVNCRSSRTVLE